MKIGLKKTLRGVALAIAAGTVVFAAAAFPTKPIHILVTSAAGGNLDVLARVIGEQMSQALGQPVIVENVTGAGGLLAIRQVAKSPADGHVLLAASNTVALAPAFKKDPGYDLAKDLVGVGDMQSVTYILVGPASEPSRTAADFIAAAKAKPGTLAFGNGGLGTSTHIPALMFAQQAGINVVHVPYKGNALALPDLIGGRLHALWDAPGAVLSMTREGKLRAFGVSTAKRDPRFPEIPSLAEQGLPDFDFKAYLGILAPAATPKDVVRKLNDAMRAAMNTPKLREWYTKSGSSPGTMTADEFTDFVRRDAERSIKLGQELGVEKE
ncbi:MAG TPA: tripartite tricarboxylate transporter substrate binding protein [Ramlibacter sp.]|nr:tripartite tricarboxylate transporter substrate binding protein [Ramlibacter sp.]